jgi:hypothetical protein
MDLRVSAKLPVQEDALVSFLESLGVQVVSRDGPVGYLWLEVDSPYEADDLEQRLRKADFHADTFDMKNYEERRRMS